MNQQQLTGQIKSINQIDLIICQKCLRDGNSELSITWSI